MACSCAADLLCHPSSDFLQHDWAALTHTGSVACSCIADTSVPTLCRSSLAARVGCCRFPHTGSAGGAKKAAPQPQQQAAPKAAVKAAARPQQQAQQQQEQGGGAFWGLFKLPWQAQADAASTRAAPQQAVQGASAAAQGSKSAQVRALESAGFYRVAVLHQHRLSASHGDNCLHAVRCTGSVEWLTLTSCKLTPLGKRSFQTHAKLVAMQGSKSAQVGIQRQLQGLEWMYMRGFIATGGDHDVPCTALAASQVDPQQVPFGMSLGRFMVCRCRARALEFWHLSQCPGGSSMAACVQGSGNGALDKTRADASTNAKEAAEWIRDWRARCSLFSEACGEYFICPLHGMPVVNSSSAHCMGCLW